MNIFLDGRSDRKAVAALMRCRLPENEGLMSLFKQLLDDTKTSLVEADGDHFRRLQGRAKVLHDFLAAVEQSPQVFERLK